MKWMKWVFGGLAVLLVISVAAVVSGGSDDEEAAETVIRATPVVPASPTPTVAVPPNPTPTVVPTSMPTPTPWGIGLLPASKSELATKAAIHGVPADQLERARRWQAQWDHWANIDAFNASMVAISEDRVIDLAESMDLCFKAPQWWDQLTTAREYGAAYQEAEPTLVAQYASLYTLESEAERGLTVVEALLAECR